jgi:hypothetical protein
MRIYIFKSETRGDLRAFAGDLRGSRLPQKHGPWTATGAIGPDNAPQLLSARDRRSNRCGGISALAPEENRSGGLTRIPSNLSKTANMTAPTSRHGYRNGLDRGMSAFITGSGSHAGAGG